MRKDSLVMLSNPDSIGFASMPVWDSGSLFDCCLTF